MFSLAREIEEIRPPGAAALLARERREIFSIHPELRTLSWGGAMLIAAGVAILLARNYERIGPAVIAAAVAVAAAAAYGYAVWRRRIGAASLVDDYVLLLAALLLSADLAFIEGQFHLLDHGWPRHLLLLAVIHGLTAYYFDSRTLLSLSIAALAGWMGFEQRVETVFRSSTETSIRAMLCAATVLLWYGIHIRLRGSPSFLRVFEHFAANLALLGGLILTGEMELLGVLVTIGFAAAAAGHGFRVRSEAFVLYAYAYAFIAVTMFLAELLDDDILIMFVVFIAAVVAIAGLFIVHRQYGRRKA